MMILTKNKFSSNLVCSYGNEAGVEATIIPDKVDFSSEEKITINCTANGNFTEHICTDGAFIPEIVECPSVSNNSDLIGKILSKLYSRICSTIYSFLLRIAINFDSVKLLSIMIIFSCIPNQELTAPTRVKLERKQVLHL